jgi:hypothetical protein
MRKKSKTVGREPNSVQKDSRVGHSKRPLRLVEIRAVEPSPDDRERFETAWRILLTGGEE